MNKLLIVLLFALLSIAFAPPPPPCDLAILGETCTEVAECCGDEDKTGCEGDVGSLTCCGKDKVRCSENSECCDGFECDTAKGECTCDLATLGETCTGVAECCGDEDKTGCEGEVGSLTCCGKDRVRCSADSECCDGFECNAGECKEPPCSKLGDTCDEESDCCGPEGNQGCEGDVGSLTCCGFAGVKCVGGDCCEGYECGTSDECEVESGNALPFDMSAWTEQGPNFYVYMLTVAVFITFICSVPCVWCLVIDRLGLCQKERYAKVVDDHDV